MSKFIRFIGYINIIYWVIIGDIDFYKVMSSILLVFLGLFIELIDFWKAECFKSRFVGIQILKELDKVFGPGSQEKFKKYAIDTAATDLKNKLESNEQLPEYMVEHLKKLKELLDKEKNT